MSLFQYYHIYYLKVFERINFKIIFLDSDELSVNILNNNYRYNFHVEIEYPKAL